MRIVFRLVPTFALIACGAGPAAPPHHGPSTASVERPATATPSPPTGAPATSTPTDRSPRQQARDAALAASTQPYLAAFTNSGAMLTRSGTVVFSSNRDGIPQLYVADAARPKDPPRRLPAPAERVVGATLTPDERTVLFASDVGANGKFHIFKVGVDGTGLLDLTPQGEVHRDPPSVARNKPGLFAYSAHSPASEKTSLFVQRLDGGAPREFYSDPRGGTLFDVSPDGKRALFVRFNSDQDTVVFDVDVDSGRATRLYPPQGQTANAKAAYSASADLVFVATQLEGHRPELLALDPKTGRTIHRYEETRLPTGSIEDVVVSPAGDRLAIGVDGGNHSEIRLLDARTLRLERTLDTPVANVGVGAFTRDGQHLTMGESLPDRPNEIFVVDTRLGGISLLRDEPRPELSALGRITVAIEEIKAFDGLVIPTNVYLPENLAANPSRKMPTLVSIHGGPSGSAYVQWNPTTRFFASLGYAIVEPNIRGSTGFGVAFEKADNREKRADALRDVETINRWARAQSWCDPSRLIIMGQSYGGYMTLLALGRQPSLWRAGIDVSGMSDLRTMEKLEDQAIRVFDETEFGILGKEDDLLFEWSPLKYVDAIVAPVFVYQGVGDPITPQNEADQMVKALRQRRVPVEYMLLANEGHGIMRRENKAEYLARAARFLEEHALP
jgi:dipeptidyl aminopeptidase/acylaminoacyl peptidase